MTTLLKNTTLCIEKVLFDTPGKITLKLEDGRIIIVPLKYFPELYKLPVEKRKKCTIVDDRTILFTYSVLIPIIVCENIGYSHSIIQSRIPCVV